MDKAADETVRYCTGCQYSIKSDTKDAIPPDATIPFPEKLGEQYAIDITRPFFNDKYIVVLIDYKSRYPEIFSTKSTTSQRIITWLKDIFAR